eukprot:233877-Pelagomonas_calceolata.AAC.4
MPPLLVLMPSATLPCTLSTASFGKHASLACHGAYSSQKKRVNLCHTNYVSLSSHRILPQATI